MKKIFIALLLGAFTLGYSQSAYYNEYRSSITGINWQTLAAELLLTPEQKEQLFSLNNRYADYDSWNRIYGSTPDRWRADRYDELERILGRDKYVKFKNKYYKGRNPVAVYNRSKNNNKRYEGNNYNSMRNGNAKGRSAVAHAYSTKNSSNSAAVKGKNKAASQGKGKK